MDQKWRQLKYGDRIYIKKLVSEYCLTSTVVFPYAHCKIKVFQDLKDQNYYAYSNIMIRDRETGDVDGVAGLGRTEEEALHDQIKNLLELILYYEEKWGRELTDEDYEYSDPCEF